MDETTSHPSSSASVTPQSSSSSLGARPADSTTQRSWRRLSVSARPNFPALPAMPQLPHLPQLPLGTPGLATLHNLRAALLGYLGEVEDSVRSLGDAGDDGVEPFGDVSSESQSDYAGSAGCDEAGSGTAGWSSGVAMNRARLRPGKGKAAALDASAPSSSSHTSGHNTARNDTSSRQEALLAHLSNLRADVQAYLPLPPIPSFRVPSLPAAPGSSAASGAVAQTQEWLRNLPGRLRAVERALPGRTEGLAREGSRLGDLISSFPFPSYAYGSEGSGDAGEDGEASLGGARKRLLEMVRSVLPSDEWEGWERLGWEETDLHPDERRSGKSRANPWASGRGGTRLTRSLSHPARMQYPATSTYDDEDYDDEGLDEDMGEDEDLDGETETGDEDADKLDERDEGVSRTRRTRATSGFLFPNRTPAATEAIKRRRNVRSRSLGSAGQAGRWAALLGDDWQDSSKDGRGIADHPDDLNEEGSGEGNALVDPVLGGIADPTTPNTVSPVRLKAPPLSRNKSSVRIGFANELGPSVAEALELSQDGTVLLEYKDLPVDWRNNEHVLTGYRFIPLHASTGPIPLIKSAFAWHNETLNIHTHFIPTVIVLCFIPFLLYSTPLPNAHPLDTIVLALYLVAAVSCMFSSAMWHVLSGCASKKWFEWGACVDYIGISWLIAASFGTVVYNAFYCRPKLVYLYLGTNAACGALGSYLPFQRWFNMRRMKPWRIAFFLFLNFAMFAPLLQLFWIHGRAAARFCVAFVPSIMAYVAGLLFYAFHFPECVWPGRFDTWGASHQIWHTGIVLAIILHYRAVFTAHDMRHDLTCAAPGAGMEVTKAVEGFVRGLWA